MLRYLSPVIVLILLTAQAQSYKPSYGEILSLSSSAPLYPPYQGGPKDLRGVIR